MPRVSIVVWVLRNLAAPPAFSAGARPKVVILGFDGTDPHLLEQWMEEGELPNLARLRQEGTYAPLQPTNPPQTPVSWSAFATGTNPGKTEIFDFLSRDPKNYLPDFAMTKEVRRPFLMGSRNGVFLGSLSAALLFVLTVGVLLFFRLGWPTRVMSGGPWRPRSASGSGSSRAGTSRRKCRTPSTSARERRCGSWPARRG
jgi:hypothetical protein